MSAPRKVLLEVVVQAPWLILTAVSGAVVLGWLAGRSGNVRVWAAVGLGSVAGLAGPLLVVLPLHGCMFAADQTPVDRLLGVVLIGAAIAASLRLGWFFLDRSPTDRADAITHGVFRGSRILPWVLLAPTLTVLAVFLYWPAFETARLSTKLVRLGAPRTADRCLANFSELIGPRSVTLLAALGLVTGALWVGVALLERHRHAGFASLAMTAAVVGTGVTLWALWAPRYRAVYLTTMVISTGVVILAMVVSLAIAYLAYQPIRGGNVYRTFLVWPYAVSPPIAGILFAVMFDPTAGIVDHLLYNTTGLSLPNYLADPWMARAVVIMASVWKLLGYNLLFYIAGLQTVPKELIEAATIDGADRWERFQHVVVPALSPITFFLIVTNLTDAFFGSYGTIDYLTKGAPAGATSTAMYEIIQVAIPGKDIGRGAAQSLMLFSLVLAVTVWQFRSTGKRVEYAN